MLQRFLGDFYFCMLNYHSISAQPSLIFASKPNKGSTHSAR